MRPWLAPFQIRCSRILLQYIQRIIVWRKWDMKSGVNSSWRRYIQILPSVTKSSLPVQNGRRKWKQCSKCAISLARIQSPSPIFKRLWSAMLLSYPMGSKHPTSTCSKEHIPLSSVLSWIVEQDRALARRSLIPVYQRFMTRSWVRICVFSYWTSPRRLVQTLLSIPYRCGSLFTLDVQLHEIVPNCSAAKRCSSLLRIGHRILRRFHRQHQVASSLHLRTAGRNIPPCSLQGLGNSKPEVKTAATQLICLLYQQLGEVVKEVVMQSELNELLKKKVMDALAETP